MTAAADPPPAPMPDDFADEAASFWEADGIPRPQAERRAWAQWERERATKPAQAEAEPPPQAEEKPQRATGP